MAGGQGMWVFGCGSLMWDAGFPYEEMVPATVHGYHRALCIFSTRYRGTPDCPGLVLGLDRGGSCVGRAFRVAAADAPAVMAYLQEREMNTNSYAPRFLRMRLADGRRAPGYAFVARRGHPQYTGKLSAERMVELVLQGHGPRGSAFDYLENTIRHLDELGIADGPLHRVYRLARAVRQRGEER